VIRNLIDGQHNNPVRIVCFNTLEGWSRDVSEGLGRTQRRGTVACPSRLH
jgi:hypothetical protein